MSYRQEGVRSIADTCQWPELATPARQDCLIRVFGELAATADRRVWFKGTSQLPPDTDCSVAELL